MTHGQAEKIASSAEALARSTDRMAEAFEVMASASQKVVALMETQAREPLRFDVEREVFGMPYEARRKEHLSRLMTGSPAVLDDHEREQRLATALATHGGQVVKRDEYQALVDRLLFLSEVTGYPRISPAHPEGQSVLSVALGILGDADVLRAIADVVRPKQ